MKNKNIHIIQDIPTIKINTLQNELVQSLLNIINNSKDAMIHLDKNKKRYIFIDVVEEAEHIQINIKDNEHQNPNTRNEQKETTKTMTMRKEEEKKEK